MNRILFETSEIADGVAEFGGERAEHVMNVLHGEIGQVLKTGELGGRIGTGVITGILDGGSRLRVKVTHTEESLAPWVDLILAPPRPRVLKRLLPQLAAMGAGRIVLVGAQKVERDFWGATLLKPENYRPLLVDGLMQAGTSVVPEIECWKSFRRFLREGLPGFTAGERIVAHPYGGGGGAVRTEPRDRPDSADASGGRSRLLLAIGPEGGWTDEEVELLEAQGFRRYSLGRRILRTDTATIALLARLDADDAGAR